MNGTRSRFLCWATALAVGCPMVGWAADADAGWTEMLATARDAGVAGPAEALVQACRAAGWDVRQTEAALGPAIEAATLGGFWDFVAIKVREGLAKGVDSAAVAEVAARRLARLHEAQALVDAWRGPTQRGAPGLVEALASGLEIGFGAETLARIVNHPGRPPPGQIRAAIEAGEVLRLAGIEEELSEALMADFLDRDLRRPDMLRAAHRARRLHQQGVTPQELRRELWGADSPEARPGPGSGGQGRRRGR